MHSRLRTLVAAATLIIWSVLQSGTAVAGAGHDRRHSAETRIVWSRFEPGSGVVRLVSAQPDGGDLRVLTHPPAGAQDINPRISPNGDRVVFERDFPDGSTQVVVVGSDGHGQRVVPLGCTAPCAADLNPSWAPDGRHLVFSRVIGPFDQVNGSARSAVLYRTDLRGHDIDRVSQPGIDGTYEDYQATFAPAGYMVFVRVRNADIKSAVFRTEPDGAPRQLTPWSLDADEAIVSPSRTGPTHDLVAFETYGHGAPTGVGQAIATVSARCRSLDSCAERIHYLTSPRTLPVQNFNPRWSPDGRRIAFVRFSFDPAAPPPHGDIWTMSWKGKDRRPVSTSPLFEFSPAWGVASD